MTTSRLHNIDSQVGRDAEPQITTNPAGAWTLGLYDNGNPTPYPVPFNLVHSATNLFGIIAPTDNEIFDLDQQNFTSTDPVPFSAGTATGGPISWAVTVNYATSGGYGKISDSLPSFPTASGATQNQTFQSEGGQVRVTASTTASDGSPLQGCVTFYIDGAQAGIPNGTITSQLETSNQSYPSSKYYPSDGTGTQGLMAQVAAKESSYEQFRYPSATNPVEPDLYPAVYAVWPAENSGGGSYIGLMQVETDANQTTDPNA